MNIINKTYYWILLEEVLKDPDTIERISNLPQPFDTYFEKIRNTMSTAENAKTDEDLANVNRNVNTYRDMITNAWLKYSKKFSPTILNEINSLFMLMTERYTKLMGGCNSGY